MIFITANIREQLKKAKLQYPCLLVMLDLIEPMLCLWDFPKIPLVEIKR